MLENQVKILFTKTSDFYSNHEKRLDELKMKLKRERNALLNGFTIYLKDGSQRKIIGIAEIKKELKKSGLKEDDFKALETDDLSLDGFKPKHIKLCELYLERKKQIRYKNKRIKEVKKQILELLEHRVNANIVTNGKDHIRILNNNQDFAEDGENVISVFDSDFTRIIKAKTNELSLDFIEVQVYYFDVIKDLINFGFMYKGEKYRYFTSSAGQIRKKKCVFIKESVWQQNEKTIMCGLTIDTINAKGGCNPNKFLAYLALTNSATDVWKEFDIDKTIVIDDFETEVAGTYDLIDDIDYSIKRVTGNVPVPHTDGSGMILPNAFGVRQKNKMIRLAWVKGLLGVFDFRKFIDVNNCSPIIKDIYGVEHDVIAEDIQVIFTKSQFKMWKYYDSWEQYKEYYKKYGCVASYLNEEEDKIKNATINYQMLQTLTDITDEEIQGIAQQSIDTVNNLCSSIDTITTAFGISPYNLHKTAYQQAIGLYPDLMNDEFFKAQLRELKDAWVKKYKSGKLKIYGKYTFVLPDFYAACQYWFNCLKNPKGLLADGEVFCWLFRKNHKLDCLRSPHLYREHAIRENVACRDNERQNELREWFTTDAIYTSTHDLISKILQFDVDGDKLLIVADRNIVEIAERNMQDIVPLYYNMKKAKDRKIDNKELYSGLNAAFTSKSIGVYSNDISKIWNSEVFISGTNEEKQEALNIIKILCMENNFAIDAAKTLYMPERPKKVHKRIRYYVDGAVPHFFLYAKDKEERQIAKLNDSTVNKVGSLIPNPRLNMRNLGLKDIDCKLMMSNPKMEHKREDEIIARYRELNKEIGADFRSALDAKITNLSEVEEKQEKQLSTLLYLEKVEYAKSELAKFGCTDVEIADILVKQLYGTKNTRFKNLLWTAYGDLLVANLQKSCKEQGRKKKKGSYAKFTSKTTKSKTDVTLRQTKEVQCIDCGEWFYVPVNNRKTCRCEDCQKEYRKDYHKNLMRKQRASQAS